MAAGACPPEGKDCGGATFNVVCGLASVDILRGFVQARLTPAVRAELGALPESDNSLIIRLKAGEVTLGALQAGVVGLAPLTIGRTTLTAPPAIRDADLRSKLASHLAAARSAVGEWNRGTLKTSVYWCGRGALGVFPIRCEAPLDEGCRGVLEAHRQTLREIAAAMRPAPATSTVLFGTLSESGTAIGVAPLYVAQDLSGEVERESSVLAHVLALERRVNINAIVTFDLADE